MARLGLDPVDIFDEHLPTIYGKKTETSKDKYEKLKKMNGEEVKK
jgi:hypothetical protein